MFPPVITCPGRVVEGETARLRRVGDRFPRWGGRRTRAGREHGADQHGADHQCGAQKRGRGRPEGGASDRVPHGVSPFVEELLECERGRRGESRMPTGWTPGGAGGARGRRRRPAPPGRPGRCPARRGSPMSGWSRRPSRTGRLRRACRRAPARGRLGVRGGRCADGCALALAGRGRGGSRCRRGRRCRRSRRGRRGRQAAGRSRSTPRCPRRSSPEEPPTACQVSPVT